MRLGRSLLYSQVPERESHYLPQKAPGEDIGVVGRQGRV